VSTCGTRLAILCCGLIPFLCAGSWKQDGKPVPDTSWAKSDGDFGAQLVFTDKPDELVAAWDKPGLAVAIKETVSVVRGKLIVGVIFFVGCARNDKGNCDAVVHFKISGPDGKPYGTPQGGEMWIGKPPPPEEQMQMGVGNIGVVIEPKDTLGTYAVVAEILDRVSKKKMVLERTFQAVETSGKN